jgi:hypothetical protein
VCNGKIPGFDLAVNRSVGDVENCFSRPPLFNHDYPHLFKFWSYHMIVSLKENITVKFGDILPLKTCIPGVSLSGGGGLDSDAMF